MRFHVVFARKCGNAFKGFRFTLFPNWANSSAMPRVGGRTVLGAVAVIVAGLASCSTSQGEERRAADAGETASGGSSGRAGNSDSGIVGQSGAGGSGVAGSAGGAGSAGNADSGADAGSTGAADAGGMTDSGGDAGQTTTVAPEAGVLDAGGLSSDAADAAVSTDSGVVVPEGGSSGNRDGSTDSGDAGATAVDCVPPAKMTGGQRYCSNRQGDAAGGYGYEIWSSGQGTGCMTVYGVDANYSATWSDATDFLSRTGLRFDKTKTPAQIGTLSATFSEAKTETPTAGKTSKIYFAVYGWAVSPLAEYYIIDDYGAFVPGPAASDGTPRTHVGTVTVDDGTYDVWQLHVKNKPAITGDNQDFDQIFSVRQSRRQCGHISVSEQFAKWAELGVQLGKLEETMLLMEAQNNSGSIDVTATLSVK